MRKAIHTQTEASYPEQVQEQLENGRHNGGFTCVTCVNTHWIPVEPLPAMFRFLF